MVHTRSRLEPYSRSQKDQNYWASMKDLSPRSRQMNRQLRGLSSSSSSLDSGSELGSDDFHPDELQHPTLLNEAFIEQITKTLPQSCPSVSGDKNVKSCMSDGEYSTSSETRILVESAQIPVVSLEERFSISLEDIRLPPPRRELPFRESRRSLTLQENPRRLNEILENESESSLCVSTSNGDDRVVNTSTEKRELPLRKSRSSSVVPKTRRMSEGTLESESELSFSDESVSSSGEIRKRVEKEKQFLRLLNLRRTSENNQNESGSDSETDKNSKQTVTKREVPRRNIRTPSKYESFDQSSKPSSKSASRKNIPFETSSTKDLMLTRSRLAQSKPSEKNRNDSQIKTTPIKSTFPGQNLQVKLKRAEVSPELLRKAQSESKPKENASDANSSNVNQKADLEDKYTKTVENNDDVAALIRDLVGSSSSDSEPETPKKRAKSPMKLKSPIKKKKITPSKKSKKSKKTKTKYICHLCQQCFTSMESLKEHDEIHSAKRIRKCKCCEKTFTSKNEYGNHVRQHHPNVDLRSRSGSKTFKCEICKDVFAYGHVLRRHEKMHRNEEKYKCNQCDAKFVRQDYLRNHERLKHSKNPYFSCEYCDRQFTYKHRRDEHERAHRNEKPFKCRFCCARFARKEYAKKHQLTHEIRTAKYTCDECDDTFVNKFSLQLHVKQHLKIKEAYETDDCIIEVTQIFINDDF